MGDILFLAHRVPFPPNRGDKVRSWHLIKGLSKLARVHVAALCDDPADMAHVDIIREYAASVTLIPHRVRKLPAMARALMKRGSASVEACASPAMHEAVARLLAEHPISTIYAFSGQMAQFVPEDLGERRFVMDFVDMDSAKFRLYGDQADGMKRRANHFEAKRLFAFEKRTAERADINLFVNEGEATMFRVMAELAKAKVTHVENGIDLAHFDPALSYAPVDIYRKPLIVFTGQMDYPPNEKAAIYFALDSLPKIQRHCPDAQFAIVGRSPTDAVCKLAKLPGVQVTGEVPDTREWLAAANVVVAPLRLARGTQNKVLEAMAMAKPVVASKRAAEGIDAKHGSEILIADCADEEAATVLRLMRDWKGAAAIGKAARARMVARYGWEARLAPLAGIIAP